MSKTMLCIIGIACIFVYFFIGNMAASFAYKITGDGGGFGCIICAFILFAWPIAIPALLMDVLSERVASWAYKKFKGGENHD